MKLSEFNIVITKESNANTLAISTEGYNAKHYYHKETSEYEMLTDAIADCYGTSSFEEKIEALYNYIMVQSDRLVKLSNLLGYDHPAIKNKRWEVIGMEMAFQLIAGCTVADHCIAKYQRKVGIYEKK